jgi:nicotinamide-nucleotide amidase
MSDHVAPLEVRVGALLKARQMTLAVAESCTGGLIMHRLTNVAGSSEYFPGGVVAYAYEVKVKMLGVNQDDLVRYGAVSETVAAQMARGVQTVFDTQIGLGVTGIAGPGGGLPDKPVGLTYIGLSGWGTIKVIRRIWAGDREQNKWSSAEAALQLLYDCLAFKD